MVNTRVNRKPGPSSFNITSLLLRQTNGHNDPVNEPDPRERHDNAANAIDEKVAPQHLSCADGLVLDSSQGKRHKRNDNDRVEDYCREHRALRRMQVHDVEFRQSWI